MKRQLSNTIYGLKFAIEKNDFKRLTSSSGKKRNDFVAKPIICLSEQWHVEHSNRNIVRETGRIRNII